MVDSQVGNLIVRLHYNVNPQLTRIRDLAILCPHLLTCWHSPLLTQHGRSDIRRSPNRERDG